MFARTFPILSRICFLLATGVVGSSMGFTSDWEREEIRVSLRNIETYFLSWVILLICHPSAVFSERSWIAFKVATASVGMSFSRAGDLIDNPSGTEPPSESEGGRRQAYHVKLLIDQYCLLADSPCQVIKDRGMYIKDYDSVARKIDGCEVFVTLPKVPMCLVRRSAYVQHVSSFTWPNCDCIERGFNNKADGRPIVECVNRMGKRLKFERQGRGYALPADGNISAVSSKKSNIPKLGKPTNRKQWGVGGGNFFAIRIFRIGGSRRPGFYPKSCEATGTYTAT